MSYRQDGPFVPLLDMDIEYQQFHSPITDEDCGLYCAAYNPRGTPVCCDHCEAVSAAYHQEWQFLEARTDLWRLWKTSDLCDASQDPNDILDETPEHMCLLICKGADKCQRTYRSFSCRQFPFFPYVTEDYRFIGLAYEWEFTHTCWVISNLARVKDDYRREFVAHFDRIFALWQEEFDSYAFHSEDMRLHFKKLRKRIPILHRNGGYYLLSPGSERMQRVNPEKMPKYSPWLLSPY